jgi:diacylglycerol kinase (ATP)
MGFFFEKRLFGGDSILESLNFHTFASKITVTRDSMSKKKLSFKRLVNSFRYAFNGIRLFVGQGQNARIHVVALCGAVAGGCFFRITYGEWIAIVLVSSIVLTAEAINSSIEALSDVVSPERNPKIKTVKDLAAGAVLLAAIAAVVVGCIIFVPRIVTLC